VQAPAPKPKRAPKPKPAPVVEAPAQEFDFKPEVQSEQPEVSAKPAAVSPQRPTEQAATPEKIEKVGEPAAESEQKPSVTGLPEAFQSAKGAVSDSFIDQAWQRLQSGKRLLFSDKKGTVENRVQSAFDSGNVKSRDDVERFVKAEAVRGKQPQSPPEAESTAIVPREKPLQGEVLPKGTEIPISMGIHRTLEDIKDELKGQYPGSSPEAIDKAAREQLDFENAQGRGAALPTTSAEEPKFKFRSTQANIPEDSEAHSALETARQRISDSDLAGKGKDVGGNHLTVRYGLKTDDVEGVRKYLKSLAPFEASLGKTEKFPPSESSDNAAVIHAPVEAPELHKINEEIAQHGEFTEPTFDEYKPHATVAYVHPDKADRYVGMKATEGKKFKVDSIAITDREGKQEVVRLEGTPQVKKTPKPGQLVMGPNGPSWYVPTEDGKKPEIPTKPAYSPKIGDIVEKDGKQYEVGFVNQGGSVRLQSPETKERIAGWHSSKDLKPVEGSSTLTEAPASEQPLDFQPETSQEFPNLSGKHPAVTPQPTETSQKFPNLSGKHPGGATALADAVYNKLKAGESLGNVTEFNKLAEEHFGSSRVSGKWTPKIF
jgi:2'-5' RNA ligase